LFLQISKKIYSLDECTLLFKVMELVRFFMLLKEDYPQC